MEWRFDANYKQENIVKKVCTELGITQKELAEIMKINDVTVRNWSSKGQIPDSSIAFMELILENQKIIKENQEMKQALSILKKYS
ncbi:XRE family transcriptional regulator [Aliarcobacter cryaerophilus]|nr:XRE family transcriptional regulator [Aliarcobacter cryaerophilus]